MSVVVGILGCIVFVTNVSGCFKRREQGHMSHECPGVVPSHMVGISHSLAWHIWGHFVHVVYLFFFVNLALK